MKTLTLPGWCRLPGLGWLLLRLLLSRSAHLPPGVWLQWASQHCARLLDLRVEITGTPPATGLIAANHLGYTDIIALASVLPCRFVAKREVADWPVFGRLAGKGDTVFLDRESKRDLARVADLLRLALRAPLPVVIFPESTSSDGSKVLPFRPSLLEPALRENSLITPLGIAYHLPGGNVGQDVAYWGDMTLFPHLLNLLSHRQITARLHFGEPRHLTTDRKTAAQSLRDEISALASR